MLVMMAKSSFGAGVRRWRSCCGTLPLRFKVDVVRPLSRRFADEAVAQRRGSQQIASAEGKLPKHLQRYVDDYDRRRTEDEQAKWLPARILRSRYGGIIGMGVAGCVAYVLYCFDDVSSEVHTLSGFVLQRLHPETARMIWLRIAAWGLLPSDYDKEDPYLVSEPLEGLKFISPIGLAAGFDTVGVGPNSFISLGFGFVEVGPVGAEDGERVRKSLAARDTNGSLTHLGKVGVALEGNREDILRLVMLLGPHADYLAFEPRLPQASAESIQAFVADVVDMAATLPVGGPKVFLRIPTRLSAVVDIAVAAQKGGVDGIIIFDGPTDAHADQSPSNQVVPVHEVVAQTYRRTHGDVPLFACGDRIHTGREILRCLEAGASAVQFSSPLLSEGPQVCRRVKNELSTLLMNESYVNLHDVVGANHRKRRKGRAKNPWGKKGAML